MLMDVGCNFHFSSGHVFLFVGGSGLQSNTLYKVDLLLRNPHFKTNSTHLNVYYRLLADPPAFQILSPPTMLLLSISNFITIYRAVCVYSTVFCILSLLFWHRWLSIRKVIRLVRKAVLPNSNLRTILCRTLRDHE